MNNLISNIQKQLGGNQNGQTLLQDQVNTQNKINDLLEKSAQAIACGPSCQKQKVADTLKQKYEDAKVNVKNAPALLDQAEKQYYLYTEGSAAYGQMKESSLIDEANAIAVETTELFNNLVNAATNLNSTYNTSLVNSQHTIELLNNYEQENSNLKKKLGNKYSDVLTNDRKTYYEQNGISTLKDWYDLWWYIYYILVVVFILAIFLSHSTMTRITMLIVCILLIFYPYYIHPIVLKIWSTIKDVNALLPKNVYKNL